MSFPLLPIGGDSCNANLCEQAGEVDSNATNDNSVAPPPPTTSKVGNTNSKVPQPTQYIASTCPTSAVSVKLVSNVSKDFNCVAGQSNVPKDFKCIPEPSKVLKIIVLL